MILQRWAYYMFNLRLKIEYICILILKWATCGLASEITQNLNGKDLQKEQNILYIIYYITLYILIYTYLPLFS